MKLILEFKDAHFILRGNLELANKFLEQIRSIGIEESVIKGIHIMRVNRSTGTTSIVLPEEANLSALAVIIEDILFNRVFNTLVGIPKIKVIIKERELGQIKGVVR